jgi:hypothetical protein
MQHNNKIKQDWQELVNVLTVAKDVEDFAYASKSDSHKNWINEMSISTLKNLCHVFNKMLCSNALSSICMARMIWTKSIFISGNQSCTKNTYLIV